MKKPRPNAALPPFPAARFDDALLRRIARLFARSVRGFADKRMRRLYPWL